MILHRFVFNYLVRHAVLSIAKGNHKRYVHMLFC